MPSKKETHIHKYKRDVLGKDYVIYKCVLPDCTHYMAENLVKGKLSICWRCGEPFVIKILHAKPHCDDCINKKDYKPEVTEDFITKVIGRS